MKTRIYTYRKINFLFKVLLLSTITLLVWNCSSDDDNQKPLLNIISPENNLTVIEGDIIEIQVQANDPDGLIENVSISYNGETISEALVPPYNFTFDTSGLTAGEHEIIAIVQDNNNLTNVASLLITVIANQQPTLKILSPENNFTVNRKEKIEIKTEANDADGSIEKVSLQVDGNLVDEVFAAPYTFVYDTSDLSEGVHTIEVIATDNKELSNSESINIMIITDPPSFMSNVSFIGTTLVRIDGLVESYGNPELEKRYFGICWNETGSPTINDNLGEIGFEIYNVIDNSGNEDVFHSKIKGLKLGTKYYVRCYAESPYTNEIYYGEEMSFTTANSYVSDSGTFVDSRDSNIYKWIKVGDKIWMAENLKYLEAATAIINYNDPDPGDSCNIIFDHNAAAQNENYQNYGCLYKGNGTTTSNYLPPSGWHVANSSEWNDLLDYVGGAEIAGTILKSEDGWDPPGSPSTNLSGFSVLPGGYRSFLYCSYTDNAGSLGKTASFYTSSNRLVGRESERVYYTFNHDSESVVLGSSDVYDELVHKELYYIRCVKDAN
ncbi:Ig-like domain-containing protein [Aquimarina sp. 2304DJ70-9]|uniref:Ig-like domain-containing protein n=1 Tax=Aquimarina penaris TaxID=3231044 RepID=UPI0034635CAC